MKVDLSLFVFLFFLNNFEKKNSLKNFWREEFIIRALNIFFYPWPFIFWCFSNLVRYFLFISTFYLMKRYEDWISMTWWLEEIFSNFFVEIYFLKFFLQNFFRFLGNYLEIFFSGKIRKIGKPWKMEHFSEIRMILIQFFSSQNFVSLPLKTKFKRFSHKKDAGSSP